MSLHYRIDGPEDGPALLLINGLFTALESWDKAMAYLGDYRVLRYDGRGQGQSPGPGPGFDLDTQVTELTELLDELNWPPSFVAGISQGGSIALELARRAPNRVAALVAADCVIRMTPLMQAKISSWLKAHKAGGPTCRFDIATPWIWSDASLSSFPDLIQSYRDKVGDHADSAVVGLLNAALSVDINPARIRRPTLMLCGEEDVLTPPFYMRSYLPSTAVFRTVPGGHASLLEHPQLWDEVVVPWLKEAARVD